MLERFTNHTPEVPTQHLVHTLIVLGNTQNPNGHNPVLDHPTRITSLAAGLLVTSGLAKMIAMFSSSPHGTNLMKKYLSDIDVPGKSLSENIISEDLDEAIQIKKFVEKNRLTDVGLISSKASENKLRFALNKVGLNLSPVSFEDEIGKRIANSAKGSHRIITELLKESLINLIRFQKMLDEVEISRLSIKTSR